LCNIAKVRRKTWIEKCLADFRSTGNLDTMRSAGIAATSLAFFRRLLTRGQVYAVPAEVLAALEHVLDGPAASVKVIENSLYARAHCGMTATTRRNVILLAGSGEEFLSYPELVLHEYFHVLRQWNTGDLTRRRYLMKFLRRGYFNNPFEIEARDFAAAASERYQTILQSGLLPETNPC
jgi:hypothetical protein